MCIWSRGWKKNCGKEVIYDELVCEWNLRSNVEMVLGLENFNGHFRKQIDGFEGIHSKNSFCERNIARDL